MVTTNHRHSPPFADQLAAARLGAEWAWDLIYRDLYGPVAGYLAARKATNPEDLTAEVFLQVARNLYRFDGDESAFRSWVFVIAHRRLIDDRRVEGRRPAISNIDETRPPVGGDVEADAIYNLGLRWVEDVVGRLTEDQRHVLILRVIADLSLEETAHMLNKRVGAIKALQRRALTSVRALIEDGTVSPWDG